MPSLSPPIAPNPFPPSCPTKQVLSNYLINPDKYHQITRSQQARYACVQAKTKPGMPAIKHNLIMSY